MWRVGRPHCRCHIGHLYHPTLSAFLNYNTFASDQFRLEPNLNENPADPTDDFSLVRPDVITQLYTNDGINYGLSLNIPIFNGFATSNNVKRAEINVKRSELQFEQAKLDLENTVNQAYVDVKCFSKASEAAQKTLDARRLAYQYAKERPVRLHQFVWSMTKGCLSQGPPKLFRHLSPTPL